MSPPVLSCSYDKNGQNDDVGVRFPVVLTIGPAAHGSASSNFPYFVAVVDAQGVVLSKQILDFDADLDGVNRDVLTVDAGTFSIPVPTGKLHSTINCSSVFK